MWLVTAFREPIAIGPLTVRWPLTDLIAASAAASVNMYAASEGNTRLLGNERADRFRGEKRARDRQRSEKTSGIYPSAVTMLWRSFVGVRRPCLSPCCKGATFCLRRRPECPEQQQCIEGDQNCRARIGDDGSPEIGDPEHGEHQEYQLETRRNDDATAVTVC